MGNWIDIESIKKIRTLTAVRVNVMFMKYKEVFVCVDLLIGDTQELEPANPDDLNIWKFGVDFLKNQ